MLPRRPPPPRVPEGIRPGAILAASLADGGCPRRESRRPLSRRPWCLSGPAAIVDAAAMGLRISERFKLPGGFRLNISRGGLGVSWGVRGFRVGMGPSGAHYTASLPGTGVSYTGSLNGLLPGSTPAPAAPKTTAPRTTAPAPDAAAEVARFEEHLRALVTLHHTGGPTWDWHAVAASTPPAAAPPGDAAAQQERARRVWLGQVAHGVLDGNVQACDAVLQYLGPYARLQELGSAVRVSITHDWCVEAWILAHDAAVIPAQQLSLTARGGLSRRAMARTRRAELYQDHVCSAALRVARETFALLPVPAVFVHVADERVDPATGRSAFVPVLSAGFDRPSFEALDLTRVDPSAAVEGFEHAMRFTRASGLAEVTPLDPSELAPTTIP